MAPQFPQIAAKPPLPQTEPTLPDPIPPAPPPTPPNVFAPIIIDNVDSVPQSGWVFVGLPKAVHAKLPDAGWLSGDRLNAPLSGERLAAPYVNAPYVKCVGGLRADLRNIPHGKHKLEFGATNKNPLPFTWHPAVDLAKMEVWFLHEGRRSARPAYWAPGAAQPGPDFFALLDYSDAHQTWHLRTRHVADRLTHDAWITFHSGSSKVDIVSHSVYGTTANDGQPQEANIGELRLCARYPMRQRFAIQNGLPEWDFGRDSHPGEDHLIIKRAGPLHRARRIECRAELFCAEGPRSAFPLTGVYTGWDGDWLAIGTAPRVPANDAADLAEQFDRYQRPARGDYTDARPLCQPPWSNQTGEQAGFGAAPLGRIVSSHASWMIDAMLWHCQSYSQRPTANKEPDGSPFRADRHPDAETMGLRPDLQWGEKDRIGWPPYGQLQWINGYVTSDDEHRDDATLCGMVALTGCPALRSIVEDHMQLGLTEVRYKLGWPVAPRAAGRLLLAYANAAWLGVEDAVTLIFRQLTNTPVARVMVRGIGLADITAIDSIGPVGEAKYGWNNPDGTPVRGWQPWQQAIAAIGLLAAYRSVGSSTSLSQKLAAAATAAVRGGFTDDLQHVYAVSEVGERVIDGAADYWTVAGALIALRLDRAHLASIDTETLTLARRVVDRYRAAGTPPGVMQSQWWAR